MEKRCFIIQIFNGLYTTVKKSKNWQQLWVPGEPAGFLLGLI
jgi:hypothetical protein